MAGVGAVAMGFLLLGMCFSTLSRVFFNKPYANIVEYTTYSLAYITFLGAPYILKRRQHINIDVIIVTLSEKVRKKIAAITDVVGAILCGVLFYYSFLVVKDNIISQTKIMDSMYTPLFLITIVIPIGLFFLAIQFIRNFYEDYTRLKEI